MKENARILLRPEVMTIPTDSPIEAFQNDSLRPILKMQHELLVSISAHYLVKRKISLEQMQKSLRREKLKDLLTRDNRFRSLLFGMIIGLFIPDELNFYLDNESEANRRITNLLQERLLSVWG